MAITQSRQVIQQEPVTRFTGADFPNGKIKRLSTHGSGLTRRTLLTVDLTGASSFLDFAQNTIDTALLPVGERQGFFMLIPINFEYGKQYTFSWGADTMVGSEFQINLAPVNLTGNTAFNFLGFDVDLNGTILALGAENLTSLAASSRGLPMFKSLTGANDGSVVKTTAGNLGNGRIIPYITFQIMPVPNNFDGIQFLANGQGPLIYGDFN